MAAKLDIVTKTHKMYAYCGYFLTKSLEVQEVHGVIGHLFVLLLPSPTFLISNEQTHKPLFRSTKTIVLQ